MSVERGLVENKRALDKMESAGRNASAGKRSTSSRNILRSASIYFGTALLCLAVLVPVLRLQKADLRIPLYSSGDAFFYSMIVKNLVENGVYATNSYLGAPYQLEFYDFPLGNTLHFVFVRLLSIFSSNFGLVINLYYLLGFCLMAVFSLFVFRQ